MNLKRRLADFAFRSGLLAPIAYFCRGRGAILMFHEVHADREMARFDGCTVAQLDVVLAALRSWDVDLIGMDDVLPRLRSDNPRQFAALTFDDGYRDNLTNALPVLELYEAPALINVPTGAVTRALYCWWLALRELFLSRDAIDLDVLGKRLEIGTRAAKLAEYRHLQAWIAEDFRRAEGLADLFAAEGIDLPVLCDRTFLDAEALRRLADHPLMTVGAHTVTHRPLATLPEAEMRAELSDNKAFLEDLLQRPVRHLAYPYGGPEQCGPREAAAAREAGFDTGISVRPGTLDAEDAEDPYLLAREDAGHRRIDERQLYGMVNGLYRLRARIANA